MSVNTKNRNYGSPLSQAQAESAKKRITNLWMRKERMENGRGYIATLWWDHHNILERYYVYEDTGNLYFHNYKTQTKHAYEAVA